MKTTQKVKSFILQLPALVLCLAAGTAVGSDTVDYSTWMHQSSKDWSNNSSYTRANWLYPEGGAAVTEGD